MESIIFTSIFIGLIIAALYSFSAEKKKEQVKGLQGLPTNDLIEQKKEIMYEIWKLRRKVFPIAWGGIGISFLLIFLANKSAALLYLGVFGVLGFCIYLIRQIGTKNQQYTLLLQSLKQYGYTSNVLKAEFKQRLQEEI